MMRDRLIALLNKLNFDYGKECIYLPEEGYISEPDFAEFFADHLLENGVILPPCKAGDKLYQIVEMPLHTFVSSFPIIAEPQQIIYTNIMGAHSCIPFDEFGKTVFLTREEAELALKVE